MEKLINEGKEAYNKEIPLAQGQKAQMIQQAEGYATERVNEGQGRTWQGLIQYLQNTEKVRK